MAVYATLADLLERFSEAELVQLTDDAGDGVVDQVKIDRALVAASAMADAHIAAQYRLPIEPAPQFIVDTVCAIARFKLYRTTPPGHVETENKSAIQTLEKVAKGILKIDSGISEHQARPGGTLVEGAERVFSRDSMRGF